MNFPLEKLFKNIQTGGSDLVMNPTPGNYIAKLDSVKIGESKNSGRTQVSWFFVVDDSAMEHAGETFAVFHGLCDKDGQEDDRGMSNIAKFIDKLEIPKPTSSGEINTPDKFISYLKQSEGCTVRLNVKKGTGEGTFINLEKVITKGDSVPSTIPMPNVPTPPTFAIGQKVECANVVYLVKSLLDGGKLIAENTTNGSIAILEVKACTLHVEKTVSPEVAPQQTTEESVDLKVGMSIKLSNGKTGEIIKLDEDTGKIYLMKDGALIEASLEEVSEIIPPPTPPKANTDNDEIPF